MALALHLFLQPKHAVLQHRGRLHQQAGSPLTLRQGNPRWRQETPPGCLHASLPTSNLQAVHNTGNSLRGRGDGIPMPC